ncbi:hypothetical protein [Prosthecomicrobium sp. N25]|uniref:hypothetical protein n=1 Tax=Prosthecomicrobium sp. N25 TaxID=3129254 RepID=UPI003077973D
MRIDGLHGTGAGRGTGRALVPATAAQRSGAGDDRGRATGRALAVIPRVEAEEAAASGTATVGAAVLAQLIGGRSERLGAAPRPRAAPFEAGRAYGEALKRLDRFPAGSMLALSC